MELLKKKHNLLRPIYIGDTDGDRRESDLAGVPFVFMTYGFGTTHKFHLQFDTFTELTDYFMSL